jgi:L-amino acid N-acyltransferase YncA
MKSKPLSDCVIDEDAFEGQVQNNDWPSDENSPELCLRQWDGDWLPAPVDWQGRHQFKKIDTFASDIATWVDRTNRHYFNIHNGTSKLVVNVKAEGRNEIIFENVPRTWTPEKIEGMPLQAFWQCLKQSSLQSIDEEDMEWSPYWQRYITSNAITQVGSDFQKPLPVPDAHLNPGDEDRDMYRKGKSQTALETTQRIEAKARQAAKKKEEWQQKRIKAMEKEARLPVIAPPPNPYKPAANIYLRPAFHRDFDQMVHIYNHYVGSHFSSAMTPMTTTEMEAKKRDIAAADLHMIVAVQKVKQITGQRTSLQSTQEKIIGFAFTDDHEGRGALFRYAADLEVYVHPEYLGKGVGKSLVDRLLFLADSQYVSRDAVEWRPISDDLHLVNAGGKRVLGTVRINVFYPADRDGETRVVWIERWLEQFKFKKWGVVEGGIKLQKNVNMACFIHKSDLEVNPITAYI